MIDIIDEVYLDIDEELAEKIDAEIDFDEKSINLIIK